MIPTAFVKQNICAKILLTMKKITSFLLSENFIVIFLSLILLICSYGPLAWQFLTPPSGKVFLGTLGYPDDFWGNFISYQEGRLGHWRHLMKITSTFRSPPTFLKAEYLFLGQLSRLFPIDQMVFFHLVRLITSMAIIAVGYLLIAQVFRTKTQRLLAFLLAFFSTSIDPANVLATLWTPLTVFMRVAYHPHYLLSFLFLLLALFFLGRALEQGRVHSLLRASFWGFLAAQVHAMTIVSLYLTFPLYLVFVFARQTKYNLKSPLLKKKALFLIVFTLISCLPLVYLYQISQLPPWDTLSKLDLYFNFKDKLTVVQFFLGIGPTAILALAGAFWAVRSGRDWPMLLAPWSVVYFLGFYFIWKIIGYNSARFLQTPFFVILGILSVFSLSALADWQRRKKLLRKGILFELFLVFFILVLSLPAYQGSLKENFRNFSHYYLYVNSSRPVVDALKWLAENTRESDVVLATPNDGNIITALCGNWPYLTTHAWSLDSYYTLENNVIQLFSQNRSKEEALLFLSQEKIKYLFYGPEERVFSGGVDLENRYPFLKKVFENPEVAIYRVTD